MKTILVATDFSRAALNAAQYAADMALVMNARVLLLHIYQVPVVYLEVPVAASEEELRQDAETEIKKLKEILDVKTGGKIKIGTEVGMGEFFPALKNACNSLQPYAVVMGSQGKTSGERLIFGSHAVYAMQHLVWPLITVPAGAAFSDIKKIGLACDFNKVIESTPIDEIKMLVNDFKAALHVVNTGKEQLADPEVVFESGMLQEMLLPLNPVYHFITHPDTDAGIMDFIKQNDIDLLVVLPKRHGLLDRLIHKSHTKQMVLHSHVPVMAVHR